MSLLRDPSGRPRWFAILAALGLVAGLTAAWWFARAPRPAPRTAPGTANMQDSGLAMPDDAIHRRFRRGGVDSTAIKTRWVDDLPGVDVAALDPARREVFVRFANAERCTCGCGYTLAACRVYDSTCEVSGPRVQSLLDSVRAGRIRSAAGLRPRPDGTPRSGAPKAGETRPGGR